MNEICCPKCGSNQLTANKKGFSGKKALVGDILVGPVGLLAGTIGSNKIKITCLACGNTFNPGDWEKKLQAQANEKIWNSKNTEERNKVRRRIWNEFFFIGGGFWLILTIYSISTNSVDLSGNVSYNFWYWSWGFFIVSSIYGYWKIGNKYEQEKKISSNENIRLKTESENWECPKCNAPNLNTTFKCNQCGYSLQ
jgi:hypothetical protein